MIFGTINNMCICKTTAKSIKRLNSVRNSAFYAISVRFEENQSSMKYAFLYYITGYVYFEMEDDTL